MYFKEGLICQCEQKQGPTYFNGSLHTSKRAYYVKSRQGLFEQKRGPKKINRASVLGLYSYVLQRGLCEQLRWYTDYNRGLPVVVRVVLEHTPNSTSKGLFLTIDRAYLAIVDD